MNSNNRAIIINNKRNNGQRGRRRSSSSLTITIKKYLLYIVFLITLSIFGGCINTYRLLLLFDYNDYDYDSNYSNNSTTTIISAPKIQHHQHSRIKKSIFNKNKNEKKKKKKNQLQLHNHHRHHQHHQQEGQQLHSTQLLSPPATTQLQQLLSSNNNTIIGKKAETPTSSNNATTASSSSSVKIRQEEEVEQLRQQQNPSKKENIITKIASGGGPKIRHDNETTTTSRQQQPAQQFQKIMTSSLSLKSVNVNDDNNEEEASSLFSFNNVTSYLHSILPSPSSNNNDNNTSSSTSTSSSSLLDIICPQKPTYEIRLLLQQQQLGSNSSSNSSSSTGIQKRDNNQSSSSSLSSSSSSYWIIQTYDENGNRKTKGGDIFFITYTSLTGLDNTTTKQRLIHEQDEYWKNLHINNNNNSSSSNNNSNIQKKKKNKNNRASRQQKQQQQQSPQGPNQLGKYGRLPPTAVALVVDNDDGTYTLNFKSVPFVSTSLEQSQSQSQQQQQQQSNNNSSSDDISIDGIWKIHMEYTCGMGRMVRPTKDDWKTGGYLYQQMFRKQLLATTTTIPSEKNNLVLPVPYIHESVVPTNNNNSIDLSIYDKIVSFGDSLMNMFVGQRDNYMKYYHSNIVEPKDNYGPFIRYDRLQQAFKMLDKFHGDLLRNNNKNKKVALIMGSGAWEMAINEGGNVPIQGYYFNNSITMYKEMVLEARKQYPNVDIIWKSPQAIHITNVDYDTCLSQPKCNTRIRYVSNAISYYLYKQQKKIMVDDLNVPFIDLWEICYLSPYAHFGVDFQHYHEYFNMLLLDMYYPPKKGKIVHVGGRPNSNYNYNYNGDLHSLKKYAIQSWA